MVLPFFLLLTTSQSAKATSLPKVKKRKKEKGKRGKKEKRRKGRKQILLGDCFILQGRQAKEYVHLELSMLTCAEALKRIPVEFSMLVQDSLSGRNAETLLWVMTRSRHT